MPILPFIDENTDVPLYVQIYNYIKNEIVTGKITKNTRLPSIRKLSNFLSVSTTSVENAYLQLVAEGFIESKPKSGYIVLDLPEPVFSLDKENMNIRPPLQSYPMFDATEYPFDFHFSMNDFSYFPFQIWRRLYTEVLQQEHKRLLFYGDLQGEMELRCEIAKYLHQYRGVKCTPEQIVIGANQFQLISLLAIMFKSYTTSMGVENPGYLTLPSVFRNHNYKVIPISLEGDGITIREIYENNLQLVCVSPSHQFPRGMTMPISKRLQLLEWAKEVDGFVIEDDYDGEFRYYGRPIPSLQGLMKNSNVIYLGGFSQILSPAICVNYMVLPEQLVESYHYHKNEMIVDQSSSRLHQKVLQLFMKRGYLEKHIRKMRKIYRTKHDLVVKSVQETFKARGKLIGKDAGFHVLLQLESNKSEKELVELSKKAGIRIIPASFTWLQPTEKIPNEFLLGFCGIELDKIEEGVRKLHKVWILDE
ncbi:PLP-dependent aminotransferase family protein [Bacillus luteolus]|uniref:PLP-dependent aminotransferase family protein n=2 Tax=Litchfieldia luteola TaxID=682179 RepID=A0ABR9QDE6_9BACI|nr:PLP-dependent aminotransferase family protein [Cytobacillus luteolus]MBE4906522.1 PLP-dependent aminotransferase family protein [Cytobacillus luteolus]MBP1941205.1 GntR family transcriptional regulator/MocR family aminotransferase [Cytobacillus luteolus]